MGFSESFKTDQLFAGGSGLFLQYFDVVKPIYLYATLSLVYGNNYGLPIEIIKNMTLSQLFEWYKQRRCINPLYSIDYMSIVPHTELDRLLNSLMNDESLYSITPLLNISRFIEVYRAQRMVFPFYIYTETENKYVKADVDNIFGTIPHYYVYGDLSLATQKCRSNFTYIFSDIELLNNTAKILRGTYSHILLASDYRYNSYAGIPKYDLKDIMANNPYIRTGTTTVMDIEIIGNMFHNICAGG